MSTTLVIFQLSFLLLFSFVIVCRSRGKDIDNYYRPLSRHIQLIEETRQVAEKDGLNAGLWGFLGLLHYEMYSLWRRGGLVDAIWCFDRALSLLQDSIDDRALRFAITFQKAITVTYLERSAEALTLFDESLKYVPDSTLDRASVLIQKAGLLLNSATLSEPSGASKLYEEAIVLNPCAVEAFWGYVTALRAMNTLTTQGWEDLILRIQTVHQHMFELGNYYRECSHYSSASTNALFSITKDYENEDTSQSMEIDEACINNEECVTRLMRQRRRLADRRSMDVDEAGHDKIESSKKKSRAVSFEELQSNAQRGSSTLLWCLYMIADKLGNKTEAWEYLLRAHTAAKGDKKYNLKDSISRFNHTVSHFVRGYWPPATRTMGSISTVPVFIVGFFRSGSTLLETMLDAHPMVWGMGEDSIVNLELHAMQEDILQAFAPKDVQSKGGRTTDDSNPSVVGVDAGGDVDVAVETIESLLQQRQPSPPQPPPPPMLSSKPGKSPSSSSASSLASIPSSQSQEDETNIEEVNEKLKRAGGNIRVLSIKRTDEPFSKTVSRNPKKETAVHTGTESGARPTQTDAHADAHMEKSDDVGRTTPEDFLSNGAAAPAHYDGTSNNANAAAAAAATAAEDMKKYAEIVNSCADRILQEMLKRAEETLQRIGDADKRQHGGALQAPRKVVDKMLMNYKLIGFIHLVFPNAVILNTVRDPMDTLFSCYKNKFSDDGTLWTHTAEDLVTEYALYLELMQHFRKELPGRIVDVSYEALVSSPERVMRWLLSGPLGLPWDDAVLDYQKQNRTVHTASVLQVQKGIYLDSVGTWRKYADQLNEISSELHKHLPRLRELGALPQIYWPPAGKMSTNTESSGTMDNNEESSVPLNWELNPDFNYSGQLSGIRTLIDSVPVTAMPPAVTANTNKCTATEEGANSWEHTSDGTAVYNSGMKNHPTKGARSLRQLLHSQSQLLQSASTEALANLLQAYDANITALLPTETSLNVPSTWNALNTSSTIHPVIALLTLKARLLLALGKPREALRSSNIALTMVEYLPTSAGISPPFIPRRDGNYASGGSSSDMDVYDVEITGIDSSILKLCKAEALLLIPTCMSDRASTVQQSLGQSSPSSSSERESGSNVDDGGVSSSITVERNAALQCRQKQAMQASQLFQEAIRLQPDDVNIYYNFFLALRVANSTLPEQWEKLMKDAEEAISSIISDTKHAAVETSRRYPNEKSKRQNESADRLVDARVSGAVWALFEASLAAQFPPNRVWRHLQNALQIEYRLLSADPSASSQAYDIRESIKRVKYIKASYTAASGFWPNRMTSGIGSASTTPIFIMGFVRSGAGFLEALLCAHPAIASVGEESALVRALDPLNKGIAEIMRAVKGRAPGSAAAATATNPLAELKKLVDVQSADILTNMTKHHGILQALEEHLQHYNNHGQLPFPSNMTSPSTNQQNIQPTFAPKRPTKIIDKLLANYFNIAFIHLLFPEATILHVVRDPLDTLFSCYRHRFGTPNLIWTLDPFTLATEYALYLELMQHFRKELPGRIVDVSYEALVSSPERVMRWLLSGPLGLPWDDAVMNNRQGASTRVQGFDAIRRQEEIHTKSVGFWRNYAAELHDLTEEFRKFLPRLRSLSALPRAPLPGYNSANSRNRRSHRTTKIEKIDMNWDMDAAFDYEGLLTKLRHAAEQVM